MTPPRSGAERVWDVTALVLVVAGAVLYLWTHFTLGAIGSDTVVLSGEPGSSVAHVDRLQTTGRVALGLIGVGIAVGLWSYFRHGRSRTTSTS